MLAVILCGVYGLWWRINCVSGVDAVGNGRRAKLVFDIWGGGILWMLRLW